MSAAADALMGIFGFKRVEGEMSKTVEDVRRAAFCKFFDGFQSTGEHCGVSIAESERELLELGFYAALDSICIELPALIEPEPPEDAFDDSWRDGYAAAYRYRNKCRAAIEQTGLGLRVL